VVCQFLMLLFFFEFGFCVFVLRRIYIQFLLLYILTLFRTFGNVLEGFHLPLFFFVCCCGGTVCLSIHFVFIDGVV
jgi:hypothetical protein